MFSYITSLLSDPKQTLIFFLLAFPGRILAISAHEFAHAWVANRCGDPTARMMGRMTLNPAKHLDLLGTLMMLLLGFGWAKPVPENPRNFKNYRKDDLMVSLAGIAMNLLLFLLGYLLCAALLFVALKRVGLANVANANELMRYAADISPSFMEQTLGRLTSYIYQMLQYFVYVNISLAIFNLLPVPPLDGYHVVNDLILKRDLFASQKAARIAMGVLFALMFTGLLGDALGYAVDGALQAVGYLTQRLFAIFGLI